MGPGGRGRSPLLPGDRTDRTGRDGTEGPKSFFLLLGFVRMFGGILKGMWAYFGRCLGGKNKEQNYRKNT